jgi:hypothetical protein
MDLKSGNSNGNIQHSLTGEGLISPRLLRLTVSGSNRQFFISFYVHLMWYARYWPASSWVWSPALSSPVIIFPIRQFHSKAMVILTSLRFNRLALDRKDSRVIEGFLIVDKKMWFEKISMDDPIRNFLKDLRVNFLWSKRQTFWMTLVGIFVRIYFFRIYGPLFVNAQELFWWFIFPFCEPSQSSKFQSPCRIGCRNRSGCQQAMNPLWIPPEIRPFESRVADGNWATTIVNVNFFFRSTINHFQNFRRSVANIMTNPL